MNLFSSQQPNRKMQLQLSPNGWSCFPTAAAIVLDVPVEELIKEIGHDGSEIVFPGLREPHCRRSFHLQEIINVCWKRGYALTPFESHPQLGARGSDSFIDIDTSWPESLNGVTGIITGYTRLGTPHAVAWDGYNVIDKSLNLDDINPDTFYAVTKIRLMDSDGLSFLGIRT
jgi:hypothetical protein